jgi:hypothetical protein
MSCMTMPPRRKRLVCRHSPSFREGPDRVFTLQTKWLWSHHKNAFSEEGYVRTQPLSAPTEVGRGFHQALASTPRSKLNQEAWKIGIPMGRQCVIHERFEHPVSHVDLNHASSTCGDAPSTIYIVRL